MATPSSPMMSPPPSPGGAAAPPPAPTSPVAASPAPATPSPQIQGGAQMGIQVASLLRAISKSFPATAPIVAKMNDDLRQLMAKMMTQGQPGQPMAPPTDG